MFSKTCEYAIKAMIFIKSNSDKQMCRLNEIAEAIDSPKAFTAKILQELRKNGLLVSETGAKGGFQIAPKRKICILEIVYAIDGDGLINNCILGLKECSSANPCPMHEKYIHAKEEIRKMLVDSHIDEFQEKINNNSIRLKSFK